MAGNSESESVSVSMQIQTKSNEASGLALFCSKLPAIDFVQHLTSILSTPT